MQVDEADLLVYPGFLRRPMFRWHDDGTPMPPPRIRPKSELFQIVLPRQAIDQDIASIQLEAGQGRKEKTKSKLFREKEKDRSSYKDDKE